jgi:hypothetical protein
MNPSSVGKAKARSEMGQQCGLSVKSINDDDDLDFTTIN